MKIIEQQIKKYRLKQKRYSTQWLVSKVRKAFKRIKQIKQSLSDFIIKDDLKKVKEEITPVKGKDYFTDIELKEVKKEVTPVKGKDYFTDKEIKEITPKRGKDYWTEQDLKEIRAFLKLRYNEASKELKSEIDKQLKEVTRRVKRYQKQGKVVKQYIDTSPEQIRDKLESLRGKDRLSMKAIKDWQEVIEEYVTSVAYAYRGGGGGGGGTSYTFTDTATIDFNVAGTDVKADLNILDEDDFASDSDVLPATQQSVKAYVDTSISGISIAHNDTTDKQGGITDEYYHLTATEHTEATRDATNSQNGLMPTGKLDNWDAGYTHSQLTSGNPHNVTKSDVGLGDVPNLDTTDAVNNEHTHTNKTTLDAIEEALTTALKSNYDTAYTHSQLTSGNPHNVSLGDLGDINTSDVNIPKLGSPTYTDLEQWTNTTQSVGKISGGAITDNGDGTASVSAGTGLIRATDSDTAQIVSFNWSTDSSVSLTDGDTNYIYVRYNSGSPDIIASTTLPSDKNTNILLGLAYRDGTDIHTITAGQIIANYPSKTLWKDLEINGKFQRVTGLMIAEETDRKFSVTAGAIYAGLTKVSIPAFDSSGTDTFTSTYRNGVGGYNFITGQTQIDHTHWDDNSGTLATLSDGWWSKYYGVFWIYMDADGHIYVLYGRGDYTLTQAQDAQPPSDIPDLLNDIGGLIGKIIIEKDASSFTSIQSSFNQTFNPSAVTDHNKLSGIQGGDGSNDEYYHQTQDENEVHNFRYNFMMS